MHTAAVAQLAVLHRDALSEVEQNTSFLYPSPTHTEMRENAEMGGFGAKQVAGPGTCMM